jgi:hypothetical protein
MDQAERIYFAHVEDEVADKAVDQVPLIGLELVVHPFDESLWPKDLNSLLATNEHP